MRIATRFEQLAHRRRSTQGRIERTLDRFIFRPWHRWFTRFPSVQWADSSLWWTSDGERFSTDDIVAGLDPMEDRWHWQTHFGTARVSTIFLALDHNWNGGWAVLWETMIFDERTGGLDHYQRRYTRRFDAAVGHVFACILLFVAIGRAELAG